jgi:hypothetical protein
MVSEIATATSAASNSGLRTLLGHDLHWWRDIANVALVVGLFVGAIGAALVVVATVFVLRWDAEIERHNEDEFAKYKVGVAVKVASSDSAIEGAKAEAAAAHLGIAKAAERAAALEKEVAASNAAAALAGRDAAQAQLALERFKAPREMTQQHFENFKSRLARFRGTGIDIIVFGESTEVMAATSIIFKGLAMAKWNVPPIRNAIGGGMWAAIPGVRVMTLQDSTPEAKAAAHELVAELNDAGIPATAEGTIPPGAAIPAAAFTGEALSADNANPIRMYIGPKAQ